MSNTLRKNRAFSFRLSKDKLREFYGLSAEAKLEWLEDANNFVNKFLSTEKRKRWEKLIKR